MTRKGKGRQEKDVGCKNVSYHFNHTKSDIQKSEMHTCVYSCSPTHTDRKMVVDVVR